MKKKKEKKLEFKIKDLANYGVITAKLDDEDMQYLWNAIEEGKKYNISVNKRLAGNISSSLAINDKDNRIFTYVCYFIQEYEKTFGRTYQLNTSYSSNRFSLDSFWVNFQKQNEFNPMHNHSGVYSFVIWMKIPTEWEEQRKLPIAKNSKYDKSIGNFSLIYTDILGGIRNTDVVMGKDKEGTLLLFPASMPHLVNPFYNCDEERVSISGNIHLKIEAKEDKTSNE